MKRLFLLLALLGGLCLPIEAQSLNDLLKGLLGSGTMTAAPAATPEKYITVRQLARTWTYTRAVVEYGGEDPLAAMAVSALSDQIEHYALKVGIVSGREKLTLQRNGTARVQIGDKSGTGSYRYNASTGEITLSVTIGDKSASLRGQTRYKEGKLTLLFPAERVLQTMKQAVPSLAENGYLKIAETVIANYPEIRIGAQF